MMPRSSRRFLAALGCAPSLLAAQSLDLTRYRVIDLTHPFNAQTIYWPNAPSPFKLERLSYGKTEGGWFYSSFAYSAPEHGGTHLDAPIHFNEHGRTADQVPPDQLMGPAVVIDISTRAAANPGYRLTADDVRAFE